MDARTGQPLWTKDVPLTEGLAGRGAWSPDGRRLALFAFDGCGYACDPQATGVRRWRVELADPATGAVVGEPRPLAGEPVEAVGWRSGTDLVLTYAPPGGGKPHVELVALRPGGGLDTLVATPVGVSNLEIARNLVEAGAYGGPAARPSIWAAPAWAHLLAAVPFLLVLWIVLRVRRRQRRV
jgi:hypothetical protein